MCTKAGYYISVWERIMSKEKKNNGQNNDYFHELTFSGCVCSINIYTHIYMYAQTYTWIYGSIVFTCTGTSLWV